MWTCADKLSGDSLWNIASLSLTTRALQTVPRVNAAPHAESDAREEQDGLEADHRQAVVSAVRPGGDIAAPPQGCDADLSARPTQLPRHASF